MKNALYYIPLVISTIIGIISPINLTIWLLSVLLLLITSICLSIKNKRINIIGYITLTIITIFYSIIGYYDYFKWTSTILALLNLIYYLFIYNKLK